jgi:transposase
MQVDETLVLGKESLELERLEISQHHLTLLVSTTATRTQCPLCGCVSDRVHSQYTRTLADLPCHGVPVTLRLRIRRFFCEQTGCRRAIFAQRIPEVADSYARKTERLERALSLVGFALGGEAGYRLAVELLGMVTSPDTLLRRLRRATLPDTAEVRVLGVDDWAFRRGKRYGTILVDLERRRAVDLLPDRQSSTLAKWLRSHPNVEFVSRDRAGAYADGIREGAPQAVQVADRWHLLKNLSEALERFVDRHRPLVEQAAANVSELQMIEYSLAKPPAAMLSSKEEGEKQLRRQNRYKRYLRVIELHRQNLSERAIARTLPINRATVRKFLHSDGFPERAANKRKGSILDPYIPYVHCRWAEGCNNAHQLWRELQACGYEGKVGMVRRYIRRLRSGLAELSPEQQVTFLGTKAAFKAPTSRRAGWWLQAELEDLDEEQQAFVERLRELCPSAARAGELARWFREMVKERRPERLGDWLDAAEQTELESFARSLRKDYEAVRAALSYEWSNGQVEGQIQRLKLVKRQMYGRANFDLLKQRVLAAA